MKKKEANEKILELMNKQDLLSQEEIELLKEIMFQCDLKIQNNEGHIPLLYALIFNKEKKLNLKEEQWNYLIENSDLKQQNNKGTIPLMYALRYSRLENLNQKQLDYLLKNSDLKQQNNNGYNSLMYALRYSRLENLNEEQKQITFQKLIEFNHENNHKSLEEINFLLYDFQFKPHEKTIHWLKENNHKNILERIKKRDVFYCLENNLNHQEKNNQTKITKIKL